MRDNAYHGNYNGGSSDYPKSTGQLVYTLGIGSLEEVALKINSTRILNPETFKLDVEATNNGRRKIVEDKGLSGVVCFKKDYYFLSLDEGSDGLLKLNYRLPTSKELADFLEKNNKRRK